jgi:hypothetical protein
MNLASKADIGILEIFPGPVAPASELAVPEVREKRAVAVIGLVVTIA